MTAPTLTEASVIPYAVVSDAWQVYRRSQQIPFPADPGDLMKAQSRLFTLAEPSASGRAPVSEADLPAIEDAVDALVAAVEWNCGGEAAEMVCGPEAAEALKAAEEER